MDCLWRVQRCIQHQRPAPTCRMACATYPAHQCPADWRYVGLAVVLQWVQLLLLFFGPGFGWNINWHGNRWAGGQGRRMPFWRAAASPLLFKSSPPESLHCPPRRIHTIRTCSFWRFYTWLKLQNAITQRSYKTYEATLFGGTALLLLVLAIVAWLHFVLRTKTHFRWQW